MQAQLLLLKQKSTSLQSFSGALVTSASLFLLLWLGFSLGVGIKTKKVQLVMLGLSGVGVNGVVVFASAYYNRKAKKRLYSVSYHLDKLQRLEQPNCYGCKYLNLNTNPKYAVHPVEQPEFCLDKEWG